MREFIFQCITQHLVHDKVPEMEAHIHNYYGDVGGFYPDGDPREHDEYEEVCDYKMISKEK